MRAPVCVALFVWLLSDAAARQFTEEEMAAVRQRIKAMFYHAYNSYLDNAFPYDELRPLTCDGQDTWGSFSLTLIDALDTLLVLGNRTEFQRVASLLQDTVDFDIDANASVFETNIRVVGGLLSAHLLAGRGGMELEPGWPCSGPLLRMAEDAARKLLPAFQTPSGMPYGTVNLLSGVSPTETPVTCTAGVGTFILEFATLSRLTGDATFEKAARQALRALWKTRSDIGLVGNHINILSLKWVAQDAGIGAGVDSYFEYLVKGAIMLQDEELLNMFLEYDRAIQNYTRFEDWYLWVQMHRGTVSMPIFQSLEAFWPGLQSLLGNLDSAVRTFQNYYSVWRQFGELIESAMYLFRATGDHTYLQLGLDALESIEKITRTPCGYASVKDVRDHALDNRMESFFLAETIKYLYLLFDPAHFLHGGGAEGDGSWEAGGEDGQCVLGAGGFIFNTEAHPLDPAALHCCSQHAAERRALADLLLHRTRETQTQGPPPGQSQTQGPPSGQSQTQGPPPGQSQTQGQPSGQSQTQGPPPSQSQTQGPPSGQSQTQGPPPSQSQTQDPPPSQSESIALKPGEKKTPPALSCPVQPFSARLAVLGQVFTDNT
ncbi:ER degradation-enhancing alpha-mannosidase-like protein 2 isoform X3 [Perca fluviatilis]|uniref:ER degradation-enhancing alpha-mannosidase-like protein 2 isoform X3 n=1 Tax=Perca fluviatilis TaxID=8168 RepID=UPI0019629CFD|nr:ER degradation-enhancing alpha-mannosidase-like protein 2 isoform X3 [Perca fluviatilis]